MVVPLHMGWRDVLFANWSADPSVVGPHVPDSVSLDTYDGRAWLSVVAFTNVDVRPYWFPLGVEVPEVNLRTYVTREGRPAVYFLSLDAADPLTVLAARMAYFLPYYFAVIDRERTADGVRFRSRRRHPGGRPATFAATYHPAGDRFESERGSLAEFLTERHRLYTETPGGRLRYVDVYHPRWPLFAADATVEENTLFRANSLPVPDGDPVCYYSPGVDVMASPSRRWVASSGGDEGRGERRTADRGVTRQ